MIIWIVLVYGVRAQVPFDPVMGVAPGIQAFAVTSNNMGNPTHTVSASYPQTFNDVPICHLGIFKIDWTSALEVSISADAITASSLNINVNTQLTVTSLSVRILVLDASLYSTPSFTYSYTLFTPPFSGLGQTILLENHQNYDMAYMNQYLSVHFSDYDNSVGQPSYQNSLYFSQSRNQLKISSPGLGYCITGGNWIMFNIVPLTRYQNQPTYTTYHLWAKNANNTVTSQILDYLTDYPDTFWIGLQLMYGAHQQDNCALDLQTMIMTNALGLVSVGMVFLKFCPDTQTYFRPLDQFCYEICPEGTYKVEIYKQCQECNAPCFGCMEGFPSICTSCTAPLVLGDVGGSNTCVCWPGTYGDPLVACHDCTIPSCLQCISEYVCIKCAPSLTLDPNTHTCLCSIGVAEVFDGQIYCISQQIQEQCPSHLVSNGAYCECPQGTSLVNDRCQ